MTVGIIGLAEGIIVIAALRIWAGSSRRRAAPGIRGMEVVWTLVPVLILFLIVALSYQAFREGRQPPPAPVGIAILRAEASLQSWLPAPLGPVHGLH